MRLFLRLALGLGIVCASLLATAAHQPSIAHADSLNHAALIIDTGGETKTMCVGFSDSTVSGLDLLTRASGVDPVVRGFSGQGGAICALCHVGCSADSSCLTCGGADYWGYFRAPSSTNAFTYSGQGAGSTSVHNGDVEGWKWGKGTAPAYQSYSSICASTPSSTTSSVRTTLVGEHVVTAPIKATQTVQSSPATTATAAASPSQTTLLDNLGPSTSQPVAVHAQKAGYTARDIGAAILLVIGIIALAFSFVRTRQRSEDIAEEEELVEEIERQEAIDKAEARATIHHVEPDTDHDELDAPKVEEAENSADKVVEIPDENS